MFSIRWHRRILQRYGFAPLIHIDISIYRTVITIDMSDSYFIQRSIIHILYDNLIIGNRYDDPDVSIVCIVSTSRELDNRSDCRFVSSRYSLCFRIFHSLFRISSPCDVLVLRNIVRTVSPSKSLSTTTLLDFVGWFHITRRLCGGRR